MRNLLSVSEQNLIISTEKKKSNSKYEVVGYVMSFLSSNYEPAHRVITLL